MLGSSRIFFLSTFSLIMLCEGSACAVTVRFHREATVSTPFIVLGDVAEMTGGTMDERARYQKARLIPSPAEGGKVFLNFDTIRNRLHALGFSMAQVEFTGPSRILVRRSGESRSTDRVHSKKSRRPTEISSHDVAKAERIVHAAIRRSLESQDRQTDWSLAEINVRLPSRDVRALLDSPNRDWAVTGWTGRQTDPQTLTLTAKTHSGPGPIVRVGCKLRMPSLVLMPNRPLPVGHVIRASELRWARSQNGTGATRMEDVVGMETKRALRPGVPIRQRDLRKKPYVRARDIVSVSARHGGITVKRTMRALKTGGLGDTIPLTTLSGSERIDARVTGYHQTEVLNSLTSQSDKRNHQMSRR